MPLTLLSIFRRDHRVQVEWLLLAGQYSPAQCHDWCNVNIFNQYTYALGLGLFPHKGPADRGKRSGRDLENRRRALHQVRRGEACEPEITYMRRELSINADRYVVEPGSNLEPALTRVLPVRVTLELISCNNKAVLCIVDRGRYRSALYALRWSGTPGAGTLWQTAQGQRLGKAGRSRRP